MHAECQVEYELCRPCLEPCGAPHTAACHSERIDKDVRRISAITVSRFVGPRRVQRQPIRHGSRARSHGPHSSRGLLQRALDQRQAALGLFAEQFFVFAAVALRAVQLVGDGQRGQHRDFLRVHRRGGVGNRAASFRRRTPPASARTLRPARREWCTSARRFALLPVNSCASPRVPLPRIVAQSDACCSRGLQAAGFRANYKHNLPDVQDASVRSSRGSVVVSAPVCHLSPAL